MTPMTNGDDGTILVLQGGGAYGAYECGVYEYLATHQLLDDLVVVAGTSAGAINAAIIATHFGSTESHGARDLDRFWHEVATPSTPSLASLPFAGEEARRWAAVWTSLLWGNPHMFT